MKHNSCRTQSVFYCRLSAVLLIFVSAYFLSLLSVRPVFAQETNQKMAATNSAQATPSQKTSRPRKEAAREDSSYRVQPGDRLEIVVYREEDLSKIYEIDPAGQLNFPLIGAIDVKGLEIEELRKLLIANLKKFLTNPQVSISRSEGTIKSISVLGFVLKPGVYDYTPNSTAMRMISTAGGFKDGANKKKIKIVRMIKGKKEIIVVNAKNIINGNTDDPKIQPGDIIFVPESIF